MSFHSLVLTIAAAVICPMHAFAHVPLNMGDREPDPNMPAIPQEKTAEPMADFETQQMALDMENADCEKLNALNHELKHAFLLTTLFLQRPGSLSKIVGPECTFLGEAIELAVITDASLTPSNKREILYHLPEMEVLIISHKEKNTIAYGLIIEEDTTLQPLEYFLENREEAERSAAIAISYAKSVENIRLPYFDPDALLDPVIQEAQQRSSSSSEKTTRTRTTETTSTSSEASVAPNTAIPSEILPPQEPTAPVVQTPPRIIDIGDTEVVYVDTPSDALPSIQPIGPVPQPEEELGQGMGYWILMIFLALVLITTGVIILRSRASAKKSYQDD